MKLLHVMALPLLLTGCSTSQPSPRSFCDIPRNTAGWSGQEFRWQGLLLLSDHGAGFFAEDCQRHGIQIEDFSAGAIKQIDAVDHDLAWARVDMSGKIWDHKLLVNSFHKIKEIDHATAYSRLKSIGY